MARDGRPPARRSCPVFQRFRTNLEASRRPVDKTVPDVESKYRCAAPDIRKTRERVRRPARTRVLQTTETRATPKKARADGRTVPRPIPD